MRYDGIQRVADDTSPTRKSRRLLLSITASKHPIFFACVALAVHVSTIERCLSFPHGGSASTRSTTSILPRPHPPPRSYHRQTVFGTVQLHASPSSDPSSSEDGRRRGENRAGGRGNDDGSGGEERLRLNFLNNNSWDDDRRPARPPPTETRSSPSPMHSSTRTASIEQAFRYWGVELASPSSSDDSNVIPVCPGTIDSVAQAAYHSISSTLYRRNKLDPNIASNAMAVSINDKRPAGFAYWPEGRDVGRLGVEIDGARFLKIEEEDNKADGGAVEGAVSFDDAQYGDREGRALRRLSLVLAYKLSRRPWIGLEDEPETNGTDSRVERADQHQKRTVAVFFNTIRQALLASQELKLLQRSAEKSSPSSSLSSSSDYDSIRILCLGQDDLPLELLTAYQNDNYHKKHPILNRRKTLQEGNVNPHNGIILVVQPSDIHTESTSYPPSSPPAVATLTHLQRLLARASIAQLPTVVLSPRLDERRRRQGYAGGTDQSGYQRASTYGGVEPPGGPTPWILRDFVPPVYSWVGAGRTGGQREMVSKEGGRFCYERVVMSQSVMESGHPWRLFVVGGAFDDGDNGGLRMEGSGSAVSARSPVRYVASTGTSSGRPTRDILRDILSVWVRDCAKKNDGRLPDRS